MPANAEDGPPPWWKILEQCDQRDRLAHRARRAPRTRFDRQQQLERWLALPVTQAAIERTRPH